MKPSSADQRTPSLAERIITKGMKLLTIDAENVLDEEVKKDNSICIFKQNRMILCMIILKTHVILRNEIGNDIFGMRLWYLI